MPSRLLIGAGWSPKGHGKRNTAAAAGAPSTSRSIPRVVGIPGLQFVNTTSTTTIDESSKRAIRKQAARHRAKRPPSSLAGTTTAAGQVHRLRQGPDGLTHTANQPPQISQRFTILSIRSDEKPSSKAADEDDASAESAWRTAVSQPQDDVPSQEEESRKLVGWPAQKRKTWLESLLALRAGVALYTPSSGAMDPFNAMPLTITPREQALVSYYFRGDRLLSLLVPYCQAWFDLAVQDKAVFHAVLSHYSATHRLRFQHESPIESMSHLSAAFRIINERLQDQTESCSNGTIGAIASLIIYESANGALAGVDLHMRGLEEMVRRRGGFEQADIPQDLKRLIAWTDLNTANDLWRPPRFPAWQLPASTEPTPEPGYFLQRSSESELEGLQYRLSSSLNLSSQPNFDVVLENLKSFAAELKVITESISPFNHPSMEVSDRIHFIERQIFDTIHSPPVQHNALDHACAVAALIYLRSNVRDSLCTFRIVGTAKLQIALQSLMELADLWTWGMEKRSREKLVWTVGFGAVSSAGGPERLWFVRLFRDLCDTFELQWWEDVRAVFETVVWRDELNTDGVRLWEEMQKIGHD